MSIQESCAGLPEGYEINPVAEVCFYFANNQQDFTRPQSTQNYNLQRSLEHKIFKKIIKAVQKKLLADDGLSEIPMEEEDINDETQEIMDENSYGLAFSEQWKEIKNDKRAIAEHMMSTLYYASAMDPQTNIYSNVQVFQMQNIDVIKKVLQLANEYAIPLDLQSIPRSCAVAHGRTALMQAIRVGDLEIVKLLVSAGARLDVKDTYGDDVFKIAFNHNQWGTLAWLQTQRKENSIENSLLEKYRLAQCLEDEDELKKLNHYFPDLVKKAGDQFKDEKIILPILKASFEKSRIEENFDQILKILSHYKDFPFSERLKLSFNTWVCKKIELGRLDLLEKFKASFAPRMEIFQNILTQMPLSGIAIRKSRFDIFDWLIENKAENRQDLEEHVNYLIQKGQWQEAEPLIEKYKPPLDQKLLAHAYGDHVNHLIQEGQWREAKPLIEKYNLPFNQKLLDSAYGIYGQVKPPLIDAILKKDKAALLFLFKHNINLNVRDREGKSALQYAIENNDTEILGMLLKQGIDVSQDYYSSSPNTDCKQIVNNRLLLKDFKEIKDQPMYNQIVKKLDLVSLDAKVDFAFILDQFKKINYVVNKLQEIKGAENLLPSLCRSAWIEFHKTLNADALFGLLEGIQHTKLFYERQFTFSDRLFNRNQDLRNKITQLNTILEDLSHVQRPDEKPRL